MVTPRDVHTLRAPRDRSNIDAASLIVRVVAVTFCMLFDGTNTGKPLVRVSHDQHVD